GPAGRGPGGRPGPPVLAGNHRLAGRASRRVQRLPRPVRDLPARGHVGCAEGPGGRGGVVGPGARGGADRRAGGAAGGAGGGGGRLEAGVVGGGGGDRGGGGEQIAELVGRGAGGSAGRFGAPSVKIMQDGIAENFTAAMTEPYRDACGCATANAGLSFVDPV